MIFLPYENITYETRLEPAEIQARLAEVIEPKQVFRMTGLFFKEGTKPYEGRLKGNSFEVSRIIGYQNSFIPKIKGEIEKDYRGSKVNVRMSLHPFVLVFLVIWLFGWVAGDIFSGKVGLDLLLSFSSGMIVFGYAFVTAAFKYESRKSKEYFSELFEAGVPWGVRGNSQR